WLACPPRCGSPRAPAGGPRRPSALFYSHSDLDRRFTECLGKVSDLFLELLLAGGGLGLAGLQAGLAAFEELPLPVPDCLLRDLLPASSLRDRDLALQHCQHDPELLLQGDSWR